MKKLSLATAISSVLFSASGAASYNDAGTDYTNTITDSYVGEQAAEPLNMANMLLCIMKATGAENFANADYRALVDSAQCEGRNGDESSQSASKIAYSEVVVSSTRADNQSPQNVTVWFQDAEEADGQYIVNTRVSAAPGPTSPFGELQFTFKHATGADKGDLSISVENGQNMISLINSFEEGGNTIEQAAIVQIDDAEGKSGRGKTQGLDWSQNPPVPIEYKLAYNENYYLKQVGSNPEVCLSRNNPRENVHSYSLFNETTGELLDIKAGFNFEYISAQSGQPQHGFVGEWGLWTEEQHQQGYVAPTTITDEDGVSYTVVTAPGKLMRQIKGQRALQDGESFEYWDGNNSVNVYWVASAGQFQGDDGSGNPDGNDAGITQNTYLWSPMLRQNINYLGNDGGSHKVAYTSNETVRANDAIFNSGAINLICYGDCPQSNISLNDALSWNFTQPYEDPSSAGIAYTLDPADMTLRLSGQSVTLNFTRDDLSDDQTFWGASSGEFVLSADAASVNSWDDLNGQGTVTYRWEMGVDSWSQLTMLKKVSDQRFYEFDKPIQVIYSHQAAHDRNGESAHDGAQVMLEYHGPGNLHGIPWEQAEGQWNALFSLADGTPVYTDTNGNRYVVKATGIDKRFMPAAGGVSDCTNSGLDLNGSSLLTLPTAANIPAIRTTWADKDALSVADKPWVVHGEVQPAASE
ncbi:hypothetical protein [Photobacterium atrarenae]|uniref:Uncharacterized protein n=1 Tax=Photobacterium atrarenae TaxID=865757 RepID=A0ABY5GMV3_9GAMM|nr:hypothetical protein [Photobacterium atrarenae]UTV30435.1 hypothetical protein NNL38_17825 [Photobacterium atrarenae]